MYGAGDSARESVANYLELGRDPASLQTPRAGDRSLHRPAHSAAPAHPGPAGPTPRPPAPPGQLLGLGTSRVVISLPTVVPRRLSHRPDARPEIKHWKKESIGSSYSSHWSRRMQQIGGDCRLLAPPAPPHAARSLPPSRPRDPPPHPGLLPLWQCLGSGSWDQAHPRRLAQAAGGRQRSWGSGQARGRLRGPPG